MTARIANRSVKWVQEIDKLAEKEGFRTPWWDELRRCAEGDFVPSKSEAWNHPVARTSLLYSIAHNFMFNLPSSDLGCIYKDT
jgi:hypothetical protein